uniref:Uncharacterized protein n=1 Tax=Bosea sp. NBC_00436 TaxID=2969620 RepID=A0A9E8CNK3_9HYPH
MTFEASFYLNRAVSPEVIMAFAETFGGRLNRMTITDASLRSRSWRPDPARIAQALDADFLPSQILLFQKGKDGNNNLPDYAMELTRLSSAEESDTIYLLSAQVPAEDEEELAADW